MPRIVTVVAAALALAFSGLSAGAVESTYKATSTATPEAAWKKIGRESGREYWSVKLDDPTFAAPLFASLVDTEDGKMFNLVWSRRSGD